MFTLKLNLFIVVSNAYKKSLNLCASLKKKYLIIHLNNDFVDHKIKR